MSRYVPSKKLLRILERPFNFFDDCDFLTKFTKLQNWGRGPFLLSHREKMTVKFGLKCCLKITHENIKIPFCQKSIVHTHIVGNIISKKYFLTFLTSELYPKNLKLTPRYWNDLDSSEYKILILIGYSRNLEGGMLLLN